MEEIEKRILVFEEEIKEMEKLVKDSYRYRYRYTDIDIDILY